MNTNLPVWLRWFWQQLGTAGRLGFWLLLGAIAVWLIQLRPRDAKLQELTNEMQAAQQAQSTQPVKKDALSIFYSHFPAFSTLPDQLAAIDTAATAADMVVRESEYRLQSVTGLPLLRYQVNLPIDGDYPSLRTFLKAVLDRSSNAILDEVRFDRDEASDVVTARLRFSFYYRDDRSPATSAGAKP
ncbi:hypothetical protein [Chitinimonas sp. BJB300]|uniref:hypothetical protein n=1 Tax=Chitinimonas sp. BJB300 TaxID=1559339 RepID=UPI000C0F1151|nr:hypothetical protein [Chitinimonas sp. BJB300]PHV13529.1 hypothetical protein CSQ89_00400 [Chitinimonas sp. BJB300]TSJ89788.1 hypothetical protein FG002_006140 [Chitinimonas sp. BJB300]